MDSLTQEVAEGIERIARRKVELGEALFDGAIDSLALVELVNFIDQIAQKYHSPTNTSALLTEDHLCIRSIADKLRRP